MDFLADYSNPFDSHNEKPLPPLPGKSIRRRYFHVSGCRGGLQFCAGLTVTVLLVNVIWTVAVTLSHGVEEGGFSEIQNGRCADTKSLSLWLHLLINVLSTSLLSASNYTMQCLASPTRKEIDKAHAKGKWLEIGVPTFTNLKRISWLRCCLCILLAFTGIPLHLLYNTAIFSELSSVTYTVATASPFLIGHENGLPATTSTPFDAFNHSDPLILLPAEWEHLRAWKKLDNLACLRTYGQSVVSAHGNLVVVTSDSNSTTSLQYIDTGGTIMSGSTGYGWMCTAYPNLTGAYGESCDIDKLKAKPGEWKVQLAGKEPYAADPNPSMDVEYCLSQSQDEHCSLQFSMLIMGIIIGMNAAKVICMLLAVRCLQESPLVTLGDAMQSFLHSNDPTTSYRCIATRSDLTSEEKIQAPLTWHDSQPRWFKGASKGRWFFCMVGSSLVLLITGILLIQGFDNNALVSRSLSHLWSLGFGAVTSESLVSAFETRSASRKTNLFRNILIANSPQVILSFLYLFYNSLYTSMLMTAEWFGYAKTRRYLRVSNPRGGQRSTYRLQLPYKYGIPLLIQSGILHWLVSQSLFLVSVQGYKTDGHIDPDHRLSTLGYSCIAIIFVIVLGILTLLVGLGMGCRKYGGGMPLAGSCSLAISAACHQPAGDLHTEHRPLMWGALEDSADVDVDWESVGHCSFTSLAVVPPREGMKYAGRAGTPPRVSV